LEKGPSRIRKKSREAIIGREGGCLWGRGVTGGGTYYNMLKGNGYNGPRKRAPDKRNGPNKEKKAFLGCRQGVHERGGSLICSPVKKGQNSVRR